MSPECEQLAQLLFEFVSGDLPPECRHLLEEHLKTCPPCYIHVQTYRVTITLTHKLPSQAMPPDVERRLRDALARECGQ
jgi:anti-sigma factor RsiW